ncbi:hypothetical protein JYU34_021247 [Plutella xylostella]|uniref:Uncharacterized protein n=1 Tax=Plutella xylostella TaxID=51655 RepID=A0ABQ7PTN9_PLUXY|nr:hypothetical protein JYU34_021246 [Plutella xylostella]KAG7296148.1 hypothetical protein JYU34_021247 [Plutella xylostella]
MSGIEIEPACFSAGAAGAAGAAERASATRTGFYRASGLRAPGPAAAAAARRRARWM